MENKIKVSAPRENPHICYIPAEYRDTITYVKTKAKKSLYEILCVCAKQSLSTKEEIKKYKEEVRSFGYKNIGDWAVDAISALSVLYKKGKLKDGQITAVEVRRKV